MSQFVVGVTGGIGSGKTTVTDFFANQGIVIVDADVIAREVVEPGSQGLAAIRDRFGEQMLLPSGALNRNALREHVFNHPQDKQWLDALLHPLIREQMQLQSAEASSQYTILSIPLLVENSLMSMVDRVLVVDVEEAMQLQRAVKRDALIKDRASNEDIQKTEATIKSIILNQCTRQQRLAVADDVVDNNKDVEHLHKQLVQLHRQYMELARTYNN